MCQPQSTHGFEIGKRLGSSSGMDSFKKQPFHHSRLPVAEMVSIPQWSEQTWTCISLVLSRDSHAGIAEGSKCRSCIARILESKNQNHNKPTISAWSLGFFQSLGSTKCCLSIFAFVPFAQGFTSSPLFETATMNLANRLAVGQ